VSTAETVLGEETLRDLDLDPDLDLQPTDLDPRAATATPGRRGVVGPNGGSMV
jgi:hypothetical protein